MQPACRRRVPAADPATSACQQRSRAPVQSDKARHAVNRHRIVTLYICTKSVFWDANRRRDPTPICSHGLPLGKLRISALLRRSIKKTASRARLLTAEPRLPTPTVRSPPTCERPLLSRANARVNGREWRKAVGSRPLSVRSLDRCRRCPTPGLAQRQTPYTHQ